MTMRMIVNMLVGRCGPKARAVLALHQRVQIPLERFDQAARRTPAGNYGDALVLSLISIIFHDVMVQEIGKQNNQVGPAR